MNCENFLKVIDDLVEGELDDQTVAYAGGHLEHCPDCRAAYEALENEKRLYGGFLFNVEPPKTLRAEFEAKMNWPPNSKPVEVETATAARFSALTYFFKWKTAWALPALLLLIGAGLAVSKSNLFESAENTGSLSANISQISTLRIPLPPDFLPAPPPEAPPKNVPTPGPGRPENIHGKKVFRILQVKNNLKTVPAGESRLSVFGLRRNENKRPTQQLTALQKEVSGQETKGLAVETTKQIEKIEMLLRSFRNAKIVEGGISYDVAYETRQARRLLGKNVELRQNAETRGDLYTEEILDKAEAVLLDIANLEKAPAPEKIAGIRERVKNQNIIAGLQVY